MWGEILKFEKSWRREEEREEKKDMERGEERGERSGEERGERRGEERGEKTDMKRGEEKGEIGRVTREERGEGGKSIPNGEGEKHFLKEDLYIKYQIIIDYFTFLPYIPLFHPHPFSFYLPLKYSAAT
jgi:hypothetical protein